MVDVNYWAVVTSVLAAFLLSSSYYAIFSVQRTAPVGSAQNTPALALWKMIPLELLRSLVVISVLALMLTRAGEFGVVEAVSAALVLWIGFPVVLLAGSVLHEGVPWQLAALHGGDWLLKLVVIALILGLWK